MEHTENKSIELGSREGEESDCARYQDGGDGFTLLYRLRCDLESRRTNELASLEHPKTMWWHLT